jgi:hypothetical protein
MQSIDYLRIGAKGRIYHYCLMGNHFHLVLQLTDPSRLSPLMAGLLLA